MNRSRIGLTAGSLSLAISALPWLGLGVGSFVIPGWNIELPRINLIENGFLNDLAEFPLHFVARIPPLDDFVYFAGEGRLTTRPFVVFVFWLLLGLCLIWLTVRQSKKVTA